MIDSNTLNEKWWWRGLKVVYLLSWIILFGFVLIIANSARPHKVQDMTQINVNCNKSENSFHFTPDNSFFTSLDDLEWTNRDEDFATKSCEYGLHRNDYSRLPSVTRNYTVSLRYITYGSWNSFWIILGVGFLSVFAIIEGIKSIILYILGISILNGMLLFCINLIIEMLSNDKKN